MGILDFRAALLVLRELGNRPSKSDYIYPKYINSFFLVTSSEPKIKQIRRKYLKPMPTENLWSMQTMTPGLANRMNVLR